MQLAAILGKYRLDGTGTIGAGRFLRCIRWIARSCGDFRSTSAQGGVKMPDFGGGGAGIICCAHAT